MQNFQKRNRYREIMRAMTPEQRRAQAEQYLARVEAQARADAAALIATRLSYAKRNVSIAQQVTDGISPTVVGAQYDMTGSAVSRIMQDYLDQAARNQ